MTAGNRKLRVSAILNSLEDNDLFAYLEEVTGEHRSMRHRAILRAGYAAIHGFPPRAIDTAHTPVPANASKATPPARKPGKKLSGLGWHKTPLVIETKPHERNHDDSSH